MYRTNAQKNHGDWTQLFHQKRDFSELTRVMKDATKNQNASSRNDYHVKEKKRRTLVLDENLSKDLKRLCQKHGVSLTAIILLALHQVLHLVVDGDQTVLAFANLQTPTDSSVQTACYALPVIVSHEGQQWLSCLNAIKQIEATVNLRRNTRHMDERQLQYGQYHCLLALASGEIATWGLIFPPALFLSEAQRGLTLTYVYDGALFDRCAIDEILRVVEVLLFQIGRKPEMAVNDLEYVSIRQKHQLDSWNDTDGVYPSSKRLHHLVEEAVERSPAKVAVVYKDVRLTYTQLNERANQLAWCLRSIFDVKPEQFVGLLLDKSELMIITILGIWKSGAAYIPIDPAYPDERVRFMIEDAKPEIILLSQRHASRLERQTSLTRERPVVQIESLIASLGGDGSITRQNLQLNLTASQLAYLTYTSGTTGLPKGILTEHRSVVNAITDLSDRYQVRAKREAILLFSAYVYEPFVRQMLMALTNSQELIIINDEEKLDPQKLTRYIEQHGITYLNGTVWALQEFDFSDCATLQRLLLAGEELTDTHYKNLRQGFNGRIINEYGVTESALVTALKAFEPDERRADRSIGKPIRNVKCYILSDELKQVPLGFGGELYIGGVGVARGYWNRPLLVKDKFIPNPYQTKAEKAWGINGRIYKTGDLARWLPNGELEYLGRKDFQVKLRGIRVEPGEIESLLSLYPGVKTSVVVARDLVNGEATKSSKHLVGYYVVEDKEILEGDLLAYLGTKLPRYMVPSRLIQVPKVPLTVNGKVDQRALPNVDVCKKSLSKAAFRHRLDSELAKIWSQTLHIPLGIIGIEDDFFRLGGDSITCIRLINRIRHDLHMDVDFEDVFSTKTLGGLSDILQRKRPKPAPQEDTPRKDMEPHCSRLPALNYPSGVDSVYLANSLQQGLMYHSMKQGDFSGAYVMHSVYRYSTQICPEKFKIAWAYAQRRYSTLRMRFTWESEIMQVVDKAQPLDWRFVDWTTAQPGATYKSRLRCLQRIDSKEPYHLEDGNLFRVYLIKENKNLFSCFFSCHHVILDGWSLPLLFSYVHQVYLQLLEGEQPSLEQEKAYGEAQNYLQEHRNDHIDYWTKEISQVSERCDLKTLVDGQGAHGVPPYDHSYLDDQKENTLVMSASKLNDICSEYGITLHSVLQFVWHAVLRTYYGGGSYTVVGTTISGRNQPIDGIELSVGLFINTLPLIVNHAEQVGKRVVDAIRDIQASVSAMNSRSNVELGRLLPGKLKHRLFDSLFVLQNYPELDGLQTDHQKKRLSFEISHEIEKLDYPLGVVARRIGNTNEISFTICYAGKEFAENVIDEFLQLVQDITRQTVQNPEQLVTDLEHLSSQCTLHSGSVSSQPGHLSYAPAKILSDYWVRKLDDYEELHLITDFPRAAGVECARDETHFGLGKETTSSLRALAEHLEVSLRAVYIGIYCLMLSCYTNQHDIVVGTPIARNDRPHQPHLPSSLDNLLVLRVVINPQVSVLDFIVSVHGNLIEAEAHYMPFQDILRVLRIENTATRHPSIQAVLALDLGAHEAESSSNMFTSHSTVSEQCLGVGYERIQFDLAVVLKESSNAMEGAFNFAKGLFLESTVHGFSTTYKHLLEQVSNMTSGNCRKIAELSLVAEASQYEVTVEPTHPRIVGKVRHGIETLHQAFEEEARVSGKKLAVIYKATNLTYQELNERANQLGRYLQDIASIRPDDLIALLLDRSEIMIISILAVWKAGAAYVPIDPEYPQERIQYILQDTRAEIVLTDQSNWPKLEKVGDQRLVVQVDHPAVTAILSQQSHSNPTTDARENNLAYAMYTSGTTGKPKGVLIEHKGVVSFRNSLRAVYFGSKSDEQQGFVLLSNYCFDMSVQQITASILCSNKLIILPNDFSVDDQCYNYLNANGLTHITATPTLMQQIDLSKLTHLRSLEVGGEEFQASHLKKIRSVFGGTIYNGYGLTETTICQAIAKYGGDAEFRNTLGELFPDTKGFVMSESLQLLPRGAVGELYLSGDCVARGYLNQPERTSQRFLRNPFRSADDIRAGKFARMYKTGDLVRYLPDGHLQYLGRRDLQIKINGFRLELGEIMSLLNSYPGIKQSAVIAREDKNSPHPKQAKRLVAYYVSDEGSLEESDILAFLQNKLPYYMVPARVVPLNRNIPLTSTGKLDMRALPDVDFSPHKEAYVAPRNVHEAQLCQAWSSVLGVDRIGIDDDFFQIGGDSILSMQVVAHVRNDLNLRITVKDLFEYKSIRKLYENGLLQNNQSTEIQDYHAEQGILVGQVPMLPIQRWFFYQNLTNRNRWNQFFSVKTPELDVERLTIALHALRDHHDAFRLRFKRTAQGYVQLYEPGHNEVDLKVLDIRSLGQDRTLKGVLTEWQSEFDIEKGPTYAIGYLHGYNDGSARVRFAMHHLVVDTVSWRILIQDLWKLYNGGSLGRKGSSYRQWARALQNYAYSKAEKSYWEDVVGGVRLANQRMPTTSTDVDYTSFTLTAGQTNSILSSCHQAYGTRINDLLLTALGCALRALTQNDTNFVTLEGHGRESVDVSLNVSRTVGWFTTMFPVALTVGNDMEDSLINVKDSLRGVPNNGLGYGAIIAYAQKPLPGVVFNYLGQFEQSTSATGFWNLVDDAGEHGLDTEPSDANLTDAALDVTALCLKGRMIFKITSHLGTAETQRFSSLFQTKLEQVIEHTLNTPPSRNRSNMDKTTLTTASAPSNDFIHYFEFRGGPSRTGPVLFMFPPGEGGAESYFNNVVRHLNSSNLTVFNNYYRHHKHPQTFEELAKIYICYIRQIQPHGPYHFLGWSFGGVLALEISRQLCSAKNNNAHDTASEKKGEEEKIANLILIDPYFNVKKALKDTGLVDDDHRQKLVPAVSDIHYNYSPSGAELRELAASDGTVGNIILFKATRVNETYRSADEFRFYEYYMRSEFNNLDTLVHRQRIRRVVMQDDSHFSWVRNEGLLESMCEVVRSCLERASST